MKKFNKGKTKNIKELTDLGLQIILNIKIVIFNDPAKNKQLSNSINYPIHIQRYTTNICKGKENVLIYLQLKYSMEMKYLKVNSLLMIISIIMKLSIF